MSLSIEIMVLSVLGRCSIMEIYQSHPENLYNHVLLSTMIVLSNIFLVSVIFVELKLDNNIIQFFF